LQKLAELDSLPHRLGMVRSGFVSGFGKCKRDGLKGFYMSTDSGGARKETILLVDDEESVRNLLTDMLTLYGYHVITARSGQEAVDLYKKKSIDIDLVVMDVIMPGLDGIEAQYEIHGFNPYAKVLLISGYPLRALPEMDSPRFIQKPFSADVLISAIRTFLDKN
jgi:DNA-binding NtrC family response regulator